MACIVLRVFQTLMIITLCAISSSGENKKNVCRTPDCYKSSEMLKMSMNSEVNPCINFYEYACGNFPSYKKGKYGPDEEYDWFRELENNLTESVKGFINDPVISNCDSVRNKMKVFYKSCLDTANMGRVAEDTIKKIIPELGLDNKFDWSRTAAKIKRIFGIDFLFKSKVVRDEKTNRRRLQITNPDSCTSPVLNQFSSYAQQISRIFSDIYGETAPILFRPPMSIGEPEFRKLAEFMVKRKENCLGSSENEHRKEKMNLNSLKKEIKSHSKGGNLLFDWDTYLNTLFEGIGGVSVNDKLELEVDRGTLKQMYSLLKETTPKTLALALWFDAFTYMVPFTTLELRKLDDDLKKKLGMKPTIRNNLDRCSSLVVKHFGLVIFQHILKKQGVSKGKELGEQMVNDLKEALIEVIYKSKWMDDKTRVEARKKISQMEAHISHSSWLCDIPWNSYYKDYQIKEGNFLLTLIGILREDVRKNLALFTELPIMEGITSKKHELSNPMKVNAVYDHYSNHISVPFGIMQRPLFGHPLTAMNYGGLGMLIGHEMNHGFDTLGRQYDEKGQLKDWWKDKTKAKYRENTKCFENAYNDIRVKVPYRGRDTFMSTTNGKITLDENIADNGGMQVALTAYRKYASNHGAEPFLVGFEDFSHEKLLTLSFANIWCGYTPQSVMEEPDLHAPKEARVNGVFMNSEEMSQIWNCPKGSKMNPVKKCRVW